MNVMKGTQSIAFSESPYLVSAGSVAGKKEGEGPLGKYFDIASDQYVLPLRPAKAHGSPGLLRMC